MQLYIRRVTVLLIKCLKMQIFPVMADNIVPKKFSACFGLVRRSLLSINDKFDCRAVTLSITRLKNRLTFLFILHRSR